ncbi:MAG: hypothetical protein OHK0039_25700 [Bacteroidia bacterium]
MLSRNAMLVVHFPCLRTRLLLWFVLLGSMPAISVGQTVFSDVTAARFSPAPVGLHNGSIDWGDFDGDGWVDLLVTGRTSAVSNSIQTRVYRYNGTIYTEFNGGLAIEDVWQSDARFGDYDNDGDLDVLVCGENSSGQRACKVYRYNGTAFTEDLTASPTLLGVSGAAVAWGDYDNDGDLDIAIAGRLNGTDVQTRLYRNDGNSVFLPDTILTGVEGGQLAWIDYDNDGSLDLSLAGGDNSGTPIFRLFRNNGSGTFSGISTGIPGVRSSTMSWADYDRDGDLDLLLAGDGGSAGVLTKVYANLGSSVFDSLNLNLPPIRDGQVAWGDYDSDGYPDLLLAGRNGPATTDRLVAVWRNTQTGSFVLQATASAELLAVNNAAAAWGDFDNDRRPDLLLTGTSSGTTTHTFKLFHNLTTGTNPAPPQPSGLQAIQIGTTVSLSWSVVAGAYPAALLPGLNYNLYIGTTPGDDDIRPAHASTATGRRRLMQNGPLQGQGWRIYDLAPGTYYWSVQSIDSDLEGSDFATEGSFTVVSTVPSATQFLDATGTAFAGAPPGLEAASVAWGDIDGDGDQDLIISGLVSTVPLTITTAAYVNTPTGFQSYASVFGTSPFNNVFNSDMAFADLDNDNDLDLIITGQGAANTRVVQVLRNNGTGFYNSLGNLGIPGVVNASVDWADYDRDGDLDLLITGTSAAGTISEVWANQFVPLGTLTFVRDVAASNDLEGVFQGDAVWGDYNNDGYPDIALTGKNSSGQLVGRIYRNNKQKRFTATSFVIPKVWLSSLAWGDINNDGLLDLAISGESQANPSPVADSLPITSVRWQIPFLPDTFYSVTASIFTPAAFGQIALGDYNDDGYADLLLTGQTSGEQHITEVYLNNGNRNNPNFLRDDLSSQFFTGVDEGSAAAWADYNNDGKLDFFLTGVTQGGGRVSKLYRNIESSPNIQPNPPRNLHAELDGFDVQLSWDAPLTPAGYDSLARPGLTYNLYIDRATTSPDTLRPTPQASLSTGYRRVVQLGNSYHSRSVTIPGLSPGTYNWSVQAIDQDFEGSAFDTVRTFTFENPTFIDNTTVLFSNASPVLQGLRDAAIAWGDFDNDGDLDLLASGLSGIGVLTRLYQYDATQDRFTTSSFSNVLSDLRGGSVDWGDYNNDNFIDALIAGESATGTPTTLVYRNISGAFSSSAGNFIVLEGVENGCARWSDYNNDGWQDILITGTSTGGRLTRIYRNTGGTGFVDAAIPNLPQLTNSWADWGDYDNDGYPDLLLVGESATGPESHLLRNDRAGSFVSVGIAGMPGLRDAHVAWGDYNADGFLDFFIGGTDGATRHALVYRNQGNGTFVQAASFTGIEGGQAAWGDYNDDGYKDLLVVGKDAVGSEARSAMLYRYNAANQTFVAETLASQAFVPTGGGGAVAWGDFDRDGKLDMALAGDRSTVPAQGALSVYRNINPSLNLAPQAPTALVATIEGDEVRLGWAPPTNVPASIRKGLSYNVYIGTTPGAFNRLSPQSHLASDERHIVAMGRVNDTTDWRFRPVTSGTYYWRVQAVDADFETGPFSAQGSFYFEPPSFDDVSETAFGGLPEGLSQAALAWGDYDNNGDLDLAVAGQGETAALAQLWRNQGNGTFAPVAAGFTPVKEAALAWADSDLDGDLDLLICGKNDANTPVTVLYRNNGSTFTPLSTTGIDSVGNGSLAWGDFDNDGDPDLLLMGEGAGGRFSDIFRNDGGNSFVALGAGLEGMTGGKAAWTDYNNDGLLDAFLAGQAGGASVRLYTNNGNAGFAAVTSTGILATADARFDWADYDLDGYTDLAMLGTSYARVYRNLGGNGSFSQTYSLESSGGLAAGAIAWGDFDDNGRPDLVYTGTTSGGQRLARVYRNRLNGAVIQFQRDSVAAVPLYPAEDGALTWGDFDNDQKLDLVMTGIRQAAAPQRNLRLYRNVDATPNQQPAIPTSLTTIQSADTMILSWRPATGRGYTYNLYVRQASGPLVQSAAANFSDGYRRIAALGNVVQDTVWKIWGLAEGDYTWNVQAIDHDYEGSAFATEQNFTYETPQFIDVTRLNVSASFDLGLQQAALAWADIDLDGDLDLAISGQTASGAARTSVLLNQGGVLTFNADASGDLAAVRSSTLAWADYDNDGDPDLLLCGETTAGVATTELYENLGNGRFQADPRGNALPNLTLAVAAWGDYDNDGDADLFLSGRRNSAQVAALYRNDGDVFAADPDFLPQAIENGAAAWADYDRDGDMDLVISGLSANTRITYLYRNRGFKGGFVRVNNTGFVGADRGSVSWGDYDNDQYADLLVTGYAAAGTGSPVSRLYRYDATAASFTEIVGAGLVPAGDGAAAWGDYNDDGFADLLITGRQLNGSRSTSLYRNDNGTAWVPETLTNTVAFRGADASADLAWADFDNDGKLDVALIGAQASGPRLALYRNFNENPNAQPPVPQPAAPIVYADSVILSWSLPGDAGLSYNVQIGTTPDGIDAWSPLSLPDGYRLVPARGNAGTRTSLRVMNLAPGTYFWRVQSVGADLEGSPFSTEGSFTFVPPHFVEVNNIVFDTVAVQGLEQADLAWGDYDNDGDLDLAVAGATGSTTFVLSIYENVAGKSLRLLTTGVSELVGVRGGSLAWGDADNDGRLDLLACGESGSGASAYLYRNTGTGFVRLDLGFEPLLAGKIQWVDANNDGRSDVFLTGTRAAGTPFTRLYRNNGGLNFAQQATPFPALSQVSAVWVDLDGNARPDLVLSGRNAADQPDSRVYVNLGGWAFAQVSNALPAGVAALEASVAAADFDLDGYPDLALAGADAAGTAHLWVLHNRADSTARFDLTSIDLPGVRGGQLAWGDYNDDAYPDLLTSGTTAAGDPLAVIYRNTGGDDLLPDSLASRLLVPVRNGAAVAWGDYDRDGKLDLALAGNDGTAPALHLFRNDQPTPNHPSLVPVVGDGSEAVRGASMVLSWQPNPAYDSLLARGLSYQIYIGTAAGLGDVLSPLATTDSADNGFRRVVRIGDAQRTEWVVGDLVEGEQYFWGVQTVEADFEGSPFAVRSFFYTPPAFEDVTDDLFPGVRPVGVRNSAISVVDYDQDGDLDVLVSGEVSATRYETSLYRKVGAAYQLDTAASQTLPGVANAASAWGDMDNDGDLDLLLSGRDLIGDFHTWVFSNDNGVFNFFDPLDGVLPDLAQSAADWGDFDNDGDQDLVFAGLQTNGQPVARIYRNEGGGLLVPDSLASAALIGIAEGDVAWGDFDTDGDLDLAITGRTQTGTTSRIYRNTGDGRLVVHAELASLRDSRLAWADLNNLGYLGLVLCGYDEQAGRPLSRLYRVDPGSGLFAFSADTTVRLPAIYQGGVIVADYDDNGFRDIVIGGTTETGSRTTKAFRALADGSIVEDLLTSNELPDTDLGDLAWGDYDRDGKIDIFLCGRSGADTTALVFAVFHNIDSTENRVPGAPGNLSESAEGPRLTLTWQPPQGYGNDQLFGLTYNLYLGTAGNPAAVASPAASLPDGYRRIVHAGNVGHAVRWTFEDIPDGNYVWSVQTVDQDNEGSVFAEPRAITFVNPYPVIVDSVFATRYNDGQAAAESYITLAGRDGLQEVIVRYKGIAEADWQTATLTDQNLRFTFDIGADEADEMGVEYFFEARSIYPGYFTRTDTHYTYRYYAAGLDVSGLRFGKDVTDYNIIGVPLVLDDAKVSAAMFDDFGTYDIFNWRFWHYDQGKTYELGYGVDAFAPGKGYWLITKESRTFNSGPGEVVHANDAAPFILQLNQGWNQIGNPYPFRIIWADVLDSLQNAPALTAKLGQPILYRDEGYVPGDGIDAMRGGFIFAEEALSLRIPVRKNPAVNRRPQDLAALHHAGALDSDTWTVPITVESGGLRYPFGGVGMHPEADLSKDRFDVVRLPRLTEYLDMSFAHPEYFAPHFSADIVPSADNFVWDFTVETGLAVEEVVLRWDAADLAGGERRLVLFDVAAQVPVDMGEVASYRFDADASGRAFRIYYGSSLWLASVLIPDRAVLALPYPNPVRHRVKIPFGLSATTDAYEVAIDLLNMQGAVVAHVGDWRLGQGFHEVEWMRDGQVAAGVYMCRLRVTGAGGEQLVYRRILLL